MVNFTFIIPHKNSPDLLERCLGSIPRRSDVQIIVVDDNSDPTIVDFNHFPGLKDSSVEVFFTKESKGAGYARNMGLSHATGKWIVFADADDFFLPRLQDAMDLFLESDSDVIFFKNQSIRIPSGEPSPRGIELNRRVDLSLSNGDCTMAVLYSSPWQKFFRLRFLSDNHIFFNEVRWGNDVVFMGRVAAAAQKLEASPLEVYCITESDNSIIKTVTLESRLCRFEQECENVEILRKTQYCSEESIYYWHFYTWFEVWKISKATAMALIPKAIRTSKGQFVKQAFKAKFC